MKMIHAEPTSFPSYKKKIEKSFIFFGLFVLTFCKSQGFIYEWNNDITILNIYHQTTTTVLLYPENACNLTQSSSSVGSSLVDPWANHNNFNNFNIFSILLAFFLLVV